MTYSPGSPGYPPGQPTGQYAAPTQQFGKVDDGPGKLPVYLTAAVAVLGLAVYVASFGPYFTGTIGAELFAPIPLYIGIVVAILAGLLAAVGLVPKQPAGHAVVAVLAVLGFLLVMGLVITAPEGCRSTGGCTSSSRSRHFRRSSRSSRCCSTPGSSPRRRRGRSTTSNSSTGSTAAREATTDSPASAPRITAVRRSISSVRDIRASTAAIPAGRPPAGTRRSRRAGPDAAHRFPGLRPAAAQLGSHHPGSGATAAVVLHCRRLRRASARAAVRSDAVVMRAARA